MNVAMHNAPLWQRHLTVPRLWALWRTGRRVVTLVVAVDFAALLLCATAFLRSTITASDLLRFGLLAAMSVVYLELSRQVDARRRLFVAVDSSASHVDVTSVWTFAAVIVLPPSLAAVTVAIAYLHISARSVRPLEGWRLYRIVYSAASMVITCVATSVLVQAISWERRGGNEALRAVVTLAAAMVVYRAVNRLLILAAIMTSVGRLRPSQWLGSRKDNVLELSMLVLGAATAVLVVQVPPLALLVLPAVFLLQHRALLKQLVEAATIDTKTELLNAAAWRQLAQRELERAGRQKTATAVLVIDMDHFKRLNDTYGHLAGDEALKAVGEALADELRGYDAVGRFGGEEFVALLPSVDGPTAVGVAERVRERIESVQVRVERRTGGIGSIAVTASVGVAAAQGGVELDDLLRAADGALYAAKAAGRNAVRRAPTQVTTAA
jgi:diguanylate cyclase (GGDEF)-like protein